MEAKESTQKEKKAYDPPKVLLHKQIKFETAQSWNPGLGNLDHSGKGNNGANWPSGNPLDTGVGTMNPPPTNTGPRNP